MKLLLDTHIWVHAVLRPERLGRHVRREIERSQNELFLSPISIWEADHVVRKGKIKPKRPFHEWLPLALAAIPVREAALTFAVAAEAARIVLPHPDFGDVYLAAIAVTLDLTLVTEDAQLLSCTWLKTMANG